MVAEDSDFFIANIKNIIDQLEIEQNSVFVRSLADLENEIDKDFQIYILDINFPSGNTLHLIPKIEKTYPDSIIIVISAQLDIKTAFKTLDLGADFYVCKGENFVPDLYSALQNSIYKLELIFRNKKMKEAIFDPSNFSFAVYALSELGVEVIYKDFDVFPEDLKRNTDEFLINLGISFMMLLGRGEDYNEGSFTFPAPNSNYFDVILFSFKLANPKAIDERLKIGYYQFCLFNQRSFKHVIPHNDVISNYIDRIKSFFQSSDNFSPNNFKEIKSRLIEWVKSDSLI